MPLPEKVIEQLGREPPKTQGWAFDILMFSGSILFIMVLLYLGITYGYEPYLNTQLSQSQDQIGKMGSSVSAADQANLISYYSQISNLRALLGKHVYPSRFFDWLEKNTEANVYFTGLTIADNNQITLTGNAKSEADVNQQAIIFEAAPEVQATNVTNVTAVTTGAGGYSFAVNLKMNPAIFLQQTK